MPGAVTKIFDFFWHELSGKSLSIIYLAGIYFFLVVFLLIAESKQFPFFEKILRIFIERIFNPLIASPFLMLFGNVTNRRLLEEIYTTSIAIQQSSLFGRLAGLKSSDIRQYYIVFTHKDNHPPIGNLDNYKIPGFPIDEAPFVMRLWYFVVNTLHLNWNQIRPICSCACKEESRADEIYKGPFAIVGSSKGNVLCKEITDKISEMDNSHILERSRRYLINVEGTTCYIQENDNKYTPDPVDPNSPPTEDKILKDYALIMKLPHLIGNQSRKYVIMLFAGCKAGGQAGITEWFFSSGNLAYLANKYSSKYFQILLEVKYRFVSQGYPDIISTDIVYEEEIKFNDNTE